VNFSGIITITTDFGSRDGYLGAMKGAILQTNASLHLVDISHDIPAQDIAHAGHVLAISVPHFPAGTVHLAVIDPSVGTQRGVLLAEIDGQFLVAPDNGLVTELLQGAQESVCRHVPASLWPQGSVSATFHGRDVFAPLAALLASGRFDPSECGEPITPVCLRTPLREVREDFVIGEIVGSDRFGNARTSLRESDVRFTSPHVAVEGMGGIPWVRTYADAPDGSLVALVGSSGWVEVAVVGGSAMDEHALEQGQTVRVAGEVDLLGV